MKKFRTYKNYTVVYDLERDGFGFIISIEKSGTAGIEKSSYFVHGKECEIKSLVCRLWRSGVTPMSLVYILEDEGYLPKPVSESDNVEGSLQNVTDVFGGSRQPNRKIFSKTDTSEYASMTGDAEEKDV